MGTLFSAPAPVRMMWEFSTWITLCPSRTRYAPMPIARHVTCTTQRRDENAARTRKKSKINQAALTMLMVTISSYACDDSPAIVPDPLRFSTPSPSSFPMTSVMTYLQRLTRSKQRVHLSLTV